MEKRREFNRSFPKSSFITIFGIDVHTTHNFATVLFYYECKEVNDQTG